MYKNIKKQGEKYMEKGIKYKKWKDCCFVCFRLYYKKFRKENIQSMFGKE